MSSNVWQHSQDVQLIYQMGEKMRILIVDDSPLVRAILKGFLDEAGYEVFEAASHQEAQTLFTSLQPNLIIKDLYTNEWDPIESIKYFKGLDPQVKIIVCSTDSSKRMILESLKAGASDYILKPLRKFDVLVMVGKVIAS